MAPSTLILMAFAPFMGAIVLGAVGLVLKEKADRWAGLVACLAIAVSFFPALNAALGYLSQNSTEVVRADLGTWISLGRYSFNAVLKLDVLSSLLCLVVTGVGLLIHIYSTGYMEHEHGRIRYFAYLNLFCGFMLILLTASSFPFMFVGWEGVGLCSYLLIGYWFEDPEKAKAGKKAFITNRVGDAGFVLAMILSFWVFGSFEMDAVHANVARINEVAPWVLEVIGVLFFLGCVGKSAQIPLYIWLPDAMAGPTPVSALIHAATMVTAGVYLLARLSPLYALAQVSGELVAATGAITAFFAATMGLAQTDIKKVLAFSTVSQLGFMVMAMGVGAPWAGIYHLITHAFFKALLFLAAGSVIHALHGEQNIFKMGGLKNYIVGTTVTFFAGYLAIIGFPGFSGWFSKDAILHAAFASGHYTVFALGTSAAILTTIYMTRMTCLVFLGVPQIPRQQLHEVHESPRRMLVPMWILALFAFIAGFFPFKTVLLEFFGSEASVHESSWISETQLAWSLTLVILATMFLTFKTYSIRPAWLKKVSEFSIRGWMEKQYRWDDFVVGFSGGITRILSFVTRWFDEEVIDRSVNLIADKASGASHAFRILQNGAVQAYALTIVGGSVFIGCLIYWGLK